VRSPEYSSEILAGLTHLGGNRAAPVHRHQNVGTVIRLRRPAVVISYRVLDQLYATACPLGRWWYENVIH
jgi:hypothetical protein